MSVTVPFCQCVCVCELRNITLHTQPNEKGSVTTSRKKSEEAIKLEYILLQVLIIVNQSILNLLRRSSRKQRLLTRVT